VVPVVEAHQRPRADTLLMFVSAVDSEVAVVEGEVVYSPTRTSLEGLHINVGQGGNRFDINQQVVVSTVFLRIKKFDTIFRFISFKNLF